jgi:hypothetical protein
MPKFVKFSPLGVEGNIKLATVSLSASWDSEEGEI